MWKHQMSVIACTFLNDKCIDTSAHTPRNAVRMLLPVGRLVATHRPYSRLAALLLVPENALRVGNPWTGTGRPAVWMGMAWSNAILSCVEGQAFVTPSDLGQTSDPSRDAWADFERRCVGQDVESIVLGRAQGVDAEVLDALVARSALASAWAKGRVAVWPQGGTAWPVPKLDDEDLRHAEGDDGLAGPRDGRALSRAYLDAVLQDVGGVNTFG